MDETNDGFEPPTGRVPPRRQTVRNGNDTSGDVRPPERRRPAEDEQVRDALMLAGIRIDTEAGARRLASFLVWGFERQDAAVRQREMRQKFVIWLLGTIGVAIVGMAGGVATKWLKLPL
jgi:hypothetical protein